MRCARRPIRRQPAVERSHDRQTAYSTSYSGTIGQTPADPSGTHSSVTAAGVMAMKRNRAPPRSENATTNEAR